MWHNTFFLLFQNKTPPFSPKKVYWIPIPNPSWCFFFVSAILGDSWKNSGCFWLFPPFPFSGFTPFRKLQTARQVLFGDRRQELYRALARALIELVVEKSPKPLVLGTSVRNHGDGKPETKKTVKEVDVNTFFVLGGKISVGWDFFLLGRWWKKWCLFFWMMCLFLFFSFWEATPEVMEWWKFGNFM